MREQASEERPEARETEPEVPSLLDLAVPLAARLRLLVLGPILAGVMALGISYLIAPTFTARTLFLPPQQQQNIAASALASLGALSGLAGTVGGIKSPIDQYVALMQSRSVADRMIDEFELMSVYDEEYRSEARKKLAKNVRMVAGKKDGLISVEVDDEDPGRAAQMANRYVDELRRLSTQLVLTEAQQRRSFFESEVAKTRERLAKTQTELQASGFTPGALKAEPRAAAETYARLRAEVTAAEVRLQTLRRGRADTSPEVQQQQTLLIALRDALSKMEANTGAAPETGYIGKYRDFKYQETLFELFSRQYELARLDESREGGLIQVVDVATPPDRKSSPKRAIIAVVTTLVSFLLLMGAVMARHWLKVASANPSTARKLDSLGAALRPGKSR